MQILVSSRHGVYMSTSALQPDPCYPRHHFTRLTHPTLSALALQGGEAILGEEANTVGWESCEGASSVRELKFMVFTCDSEISVRLGGARSQYPAVPAPPSLLKERKEAGRLCITCIPIPSTSASPLAFPSLGYSPTRFLSTSPGCCHRHTPRDIRFRTLLPG